MKAVRIKYLLVAVFFLFCSTFVSTSQAQNEDYSKPQELVDQSITVLKRFASKKEFENFLTLAKRAKGILVVPQMLKGGFLVGGSGGSGVLLAREKDGVTWSYPAFYTMGAVSFGLQIGAESSQIMLLVMTEKGMDSMLSNSVKLGGDASVAVGPVGAGAKAATADILSYSLSKGAYTGFSVEGAIVKVRESLNETYYGKKVSPADIFIRKSATNANAEELRQEVAKITK
jgi:lipid-binding SYLF domain-containing protein